MVQGAAPSQPGLYCGHLLHALTDLFHDKQHGLLQVGAWRIELHLLVIKCELHFQQRKFGFVFKVKKAGVSIKGPLQQISQLK